MRVPAILQIARSLIPVVAGLALGILLGKSPANIAADSSDVSKPRPARLSAISSQSAEARARTRINEKASPSKLWDALQECDSAALARLYQVTKRNADFMRQFLVASRWVEIDPEAAAHAAAAKWDGLIAVPKLVGVWASINPDAALDFLLASPTINGQVFAIGATITEAQTIPGFDIKPLLDRLPAYVDDIKFTVDLSDGEQIEKIRTYLSGTKELPLKHEVAIDWMLDEFVDAALEDTNASKLIQLYDTPNSGRLGAPSSTLVAAYLREDPAAAGDWIFNQHDSFQASYIANSVIGAINESNPDGAAKLIAQMPPSGARREAISDLASTWKKVDPERYQQWYQELDRVDRDSLDATFEAENEGTKE